MRYFLPLLPKLPGPPGLHSDPCETGDCSCLPVRHPMEAPTSYTCTMCHSHTPSEPRVQHKSPVLALLWASVLLHKTHLYKEGLGSKFH